MVKLYQISQSKNVQKGSYEVLRRIISLFEYSANFWANEKCNYFNDFDWSRCVSSMSSVPTMATLENQSQSIKLSIEFHSCSIYLFADKMDNFLWLTMIMAAWITTTGVSTVTTAAATAEESSWSESYTSENTDEYLKSKENEMNLVSFCGLCITRNCSNLLISLNCTHLHFDKMFRFGCCFLYKRQLTDDLIHALSAFYTIAKTNQKSHFTQFCNEISVFFLLSS